MGRPRNPTVINERNGAYAKDPQRAAQRENEPVPPGPLGDPPEYFLEDEQKLWRETEAQAAAGVLTVSDRVLLEAYCLLVARMRRREPMKAAEVNLILSCLARMGFTPADRSRINAPSKQKQDSESEFHALAASARGRRADLKQ